MTLYPNGIDSTLTLPTVPGSTPEAIAINAVRDATIAVETELGISPKGIYSNVANRLAILESRVGPGPGGGGGLIDTSQLIGVVSIVNGGTGLSAIGSANTVLTSNGTALVYKLLDNNNIDAAAAIAGSKIVPNFGAQAVTGSLYNVGSGGPTVTQGTGAPLSSAPDGSIFLRTDGTSSDGLYTRQSGTWSPVGSTTVAPGGANGEIQYNDGGSFNGATNVTTGSGFISITSGSGYISVGSGTTSTTGVFRLPYNAASPVRVLGVKDSTNTDRSIIQYGSGDAITMGNSAMDYTLQSFGGNSVVMNNSGIGVSANSTAGVLTLTNTSITTVVPTVSFTTAVVAPTITQVDNTTNSATAQPLTVNAQNATGTTSTGGDLIVRSGSGTTRPGSINFNVGSTLAGYFDGSILGGSVPLRLGSAANSNINYLNSTQPSSAAMIYANGTASATAIFNSNGTTTRSIISSINSSSGSATGINLTAAGTAHTIAAYQNNGIIEQIGPTTTALILSRIQHDETGRVITGRVWQTGAWCIGDAAQNDTSSEAQAGLAGAVINLSHISSGSISTVANQAVIYNSAGVLSLQGNTGQNFVAGTTSVMTTSSTQITSNVATIQFTTATTNPAINQAPNVTSGGTGQNFSISAQNATGGGASTGGSLFLNAGTGATNGSIRFALGGSTAIQVTALPTGNSGFTFVAGATQANYTHTATASAIGAPMQFTAQSTSLDASTGGSLGLSAGSATNTNGTGGSINISTGTGNTNPGSINFRVGTTTFATFLTPNPAGTVDLNFVSTITAPRIVQAGTSVASATGAPFVLQAQNATGTTSTGGELRLTSGTGTTVAGNVVVQTGGVSKITVSPTLTTFADPIAMGGATPSTVGLIRIPNATVGAVIAMRNVGNTNNLHMIGTNANSNLYIGTDPSFTANNQVSAISMYATTNGSIAIGQGGSTEIYMTGSPRRLETWIPQAGSNSASLPHRWLQTSVAQVGTSDTTLTNTQYNAPLLIATGSPGGAFNWIGPNNSGAWFYVTNSTDGILTFKVSGQPGVPIAIGKSAIVTHDGTDYVRITPDSFQDDLDFPAAAVNPSISQLTDPTNSITGDSLTIQAQNATGTTTTGGALNLTSGTGTTAHGAVNLQVGGTNVISFTSTTGATIKLTDIVSDGNSKVTVTDAIRHVSTTNDTITDIYTWTITDEATTTVDALITAIESDGSAGASYKRTIVFRRDGGTVTTIGAIIDNMTEEDSAAWDVTIDNSTSTGRIRVTGEAATNITWGLSARLQVTIP